ncbi:MULTISPECIES: hypothetical protein [Burkholderia]|uniref:Uncharacterized protein n=2 Tax=Burkholderia cenocepacia TaxID=95486 RepID=A0ABD4U7G6_9BURK|nr:MULTISPECIES: hypothetical protein [Burkholderia]MBG0870202.1 hypothetical protein [Burkholderia sp. 9777_1386]MBJ9898401.1 hypothetical protein [Burkholderia cenocepacia]MBJ9916577.1 hypothetical protein [Burkholderia cenocepacia]MBR8262146.1 hypothetical protein [Burkholderia cenocepacia]MCW3542791.1 hypothetical protein [Burkholderia cenocepacia]
MSTGIAIYGIDPTRVAAILEIAESLFRRLGEEVSEVIFIEFGARDGAKIIEDHKISISDLRKGVSDGGIVAFQICSNGKDGGVPVISLGCNNQKFGGISFVDVQIEEPIYKIRAEIERFFENFVARLGCKYAIAYDAKDSSTAYKYSTGVNLIRIFPFENTSLFTRELPGRAPGAASYERVMLRMIYPLNVLNEEHLEIRVGDLSLREWITADSCRGYLKSISNGMWLWSLKETDLAEINNACGEAGILIAWKKASTDRAVRKLP